MRNFLICLFSLLLSYQTQAQTLYAEDDYYTTTSGNALTMSVLDNDFSMSGSFGAIQITAPPLSGADIILLAEGLVVYIPPAGFVGDDVFTYSISDFFGGTASAEVYISVIAGCPDLFAVISAIEPIFCYGECTAILQIAVWGGTEPYSVVWENGSTGMAIDLVCAGLHSAYVTDGTGCTTIATLFVNEAPQIEVITTANPSNITLGESSQLNAVATGGTAAYSYEWWPSTGLNNAFIPNPIATPTSTTTYLVYVTDSFGCTVSQYVVVGVGGGGGSIVAFDDYYEIPSSGPFTMNVLSNDIFPGSVFPSITGGPSNGTATASGNYIIYVPNPLFSGYDTLTYSICTFLGECSTATVVIYVNTGGGGSCDDFSVFINVPTYTLCGGECNGTAYPIVTGGTPPYTYMWSNGSTSIPLINACPGVYLLTVADSNGCTFTAAITFAEAPAIVATAVATPSTITFGGSSQLIADASGGTAPYAFQWTPSTSLSNPNISNPIASPAVTTTYLVTVVDANGCTAQYPVVVSVGGGGCDLFPMVSTTLPSCWGACNGSMAVTVMGGTPPYSYQWMGPGGFLCMGDICNNLCPGEYILVITDATGCAHTSVINIVSTSPPLVVTTTTDTPVITPGETATITSIANGGNPPYFYQWNTGEAGTTAQATSAGIYCVTVTDANGCTAQSCVTITENPFFPITVIADTVYIEAGQTTIIDPLANDVGTGALNLLSAVSEAPFTIDYDNDEITLLAPDSPDTLYISYVVADATGATGTGTIVVIVLPAGTCDSNCVWPGDADNDGVANNFDVLNIGLAYGFTGVARADQSIAWYGHSAADWSDSFSDGTNFKFADSNGGGLINAADTAAITLNYGLTHGKNEADSETGAPMFFMLDNQTGTEVGDVITLSILLGDAANLITDFYGIGYSINYDGTLLQLTQLSLPATSWAGNDANTLFFKKNLGNGQTDAALTRIDQTNVSGQGLIAQATFVIIENIDGKNEESAGFDLSFSLDNVKCISNTGLEIPVDGQSFNLSNTSTPQQGVTDMVKIYPNPVQGNLHVQAQQATKMQITNLLGQTVYQTNTMGSETHTIDTHQWQTGLYLLTVDTAQGKQVFKILVEGK